MKSKEAAEVRQDKLKNLRLEYEKLLPEQLKEISRCVGVVSRGINEAAVYDRLYRSVHRLAGSGATFGFRRLSEVAHDLELLVKSWNADSHIPGPEEVCRATSLSEALIDVLDSE